MSSVEPPFAALSMHCAYFFGTGAPLFGGCPLVREDDLLEFPEL
jgi:hypothetical protein